MIKSAVTSAIVAAALCGGTAAATGETLSALTWQKRIVIVFAPNDNPRIDEQRRLFAGQEAELDDRDVLAFAVAGDSLQPIYGTPPVAETADALRRRFDVRPDAFEAILIGKDGGVKWRGDQPVRAAQLFGLIDAMPMRRRGD